DEIYWSLLKRGKEDVEAVKIDDVRYCVFTTSPILKYQSYREIIDLWVEGEERDRQTPVLLEMVDNILLFLYGETGKLEVTVNGSLTERLDDVFPEVRYGRTYKSFSSYLRSRKVSHFVEAEVLENLKKIGISYVPAINNFLVLRFDPVGAAQEAARFVVYAMRDRIARKSDSKDRVRPDDRFYAFVLEEALVCLGSKVINPTQDCYRTDLLLGSIDTRGVVRRPVSSFSLEETREIVRLLKYHFRREVKAKGTLKITRKLREIHNLGVRKRSLVAKTLGHMLGEAIYHSFHGGLVSRTDVIDLYRETFEVPGKAKVLYMNWVRKTKPFRGGWGKRR
ncbi:MAG: hypothetical protein KAX38_00590, partial [Candidatus Krumholzibacteria bacterium]|nr:hypothetical protein [Candidatus Krumholzibacteria bacterium]